MPSPEVAPDEAQRHFILASTACCTSLIGRIRPDQPEAGRRADGREIAELGEVEARGLVAGELREGGAGAVRQRDLQAVGRRGVEAVERDQPAGAGLVLDDDGRAQRLGEIGRDHAREHVVAAAGAGADDHPHGLAGVERLLRLPAPMPARTTPPAPIANDRTARVAERIIAMDRHPTLPAFALLVFESHKSKAKRIRRHQPPPPPPPPPPPEEPPPLLPPPPSRWSRARSTTTRWSTTDRCRGDRRTTPDRCDQSRLPTYQAVAAAAVPAAASTPANFAAQAFWQSSATA